MKIVELRQALKVKGLLAVGNKNDLVERLIASETEQGNDDQGSNMESTEGDEDLLNSSKPDEMEKEESIKDSNVDAFDEDMLSTENNETDQESKDINASTEATVQKETTTAIRTEETKDKTTTQSRMTTASYLSKESIRPTDEKSMESDLPTCTSTESTTEIKQASDAKFKLRSERFGGASCAAAEARRAARVARFGVVDKPTTGRVEKRREVAPAVVRRDKLVRASLGILQAPEVTSPIIRKRQERFGVVKMDEAPQLSVTINKGGRRVSSNFSSYQAAAPKAWAKPVAMDEKMMARIQRFKV